MLTSLLLYSAGAYVLDVLARPADAARHARAAADARGKPLLVVGAGTGRSSLRALLFGAQLVGDVNTDLVGSEACGPTTVCRADAQDLPFADKQFGAVLCTHVLEHCDHPRRAYRELVRVADEVFVVVPRWWAPHTWLHPGHRWYLTRSGRWVPLWQ